MSGKATILIVDDEEHLQENLVAYLEDEGYAVVTAGDGESGLERIKSQKFDIGIIDMRLPGMDGNTFILKAHKVQPAMKYIIHTGSMTYSIPRALMEIGIGRDQVFLKPVIDMTTMVGTIQKLLEKD
ncbi:MAG TPA: response regulator [Spirochaetota bacterium]|jgi:DNA-binding NtrC family response regulator|nr:response regulator [Spirochaetota bacterium]HPV42438.1 response regulator [Spirochaetota bacterium]